MQKVWYFFDIMLTPETQNCKPEKTLRDLLKQQRTKVEEIKKKTNYYSTRNLIERYDDASDSPLRRRPVAGQQGQGVLVSGPATPQRQPQPSMQAQTPALPSHLSTLSVAHRVSLFNKLE
jgi:endoplasmic reticulum junction formation protein lunapark